MKINGLISFHDFINRIQKERRLTFKFSFLHKDRYNLLSLGQKSGFKKGSSETYRTTENRQEELSNLTTAIKKSKSLCKELKK